VIANSVEHFSSLQANSFPAIQEFTPILWNLKVQYSVHKNPPLIVILNQMSSVLPSCFFNIRF
jgi:hypothetical protein